MQGIRYVYWQDGGAWLGHLEEYPDYLTQGESLADLEEHLRDLLKDLSSGIIPSGCKVAELPLALSARGFTILPFWCKHEP